MKRPIKLNAQQQKRTEQQVESQTSQQVPQEFASAEEMLRHDAIHTPVPPAIGYRLRESIGQTPPPPRSWWQRWFRS